MWQKLNGEQIRPFMLAFIIVGIMALLFGGYRFVDSATRIQNNAAFQAKNGVQTISPENQAGAQVLFAAGAEYRDLLGERNEAIIFIGAGLVLLSLGWLGNDIIRSRHKVIEAS